MIWFFFVGVQGAAGGFVRADFETLLELFRQYDISLLDPITPLRSRCANGLFLQTDMWVRIMDRTDDVPQKPIP